MRNLLGDGNRGDCASLGRAAFIVEARVQDRAGRLGAVGATILQMDAHAQDAVRGQGLEIVDGRSGAVCRQSVASLADDLNGQAHGEFSTQDHVRGPHRSPRGSVDEVRALGQRPPARARDRRQDQGQFRFEHAHTDRAGELGRANS